MTPAPALGRLTADQRKIRDAVRTLARGRVAPRAAEIDGSAEFPDALRNLLAEQGFLGLPFPERHGGLGADLLTIGLAIEALSAASATTGLILAVQELGSLPLLLAGSEEQLRRVAYSIQIGQTGRTVKPAVHLAFGVSGAIQHKVGMQTAETTIAVNGDPDAPIGEFADLFVVADQAAVVPELTAAPRARAGQGTVP